MVTLDKKLSLNQYVTIFNFLSKIIYYSCNESISPLSVRRINCNELIPKYEVLDGIKSFIEKMYDGCNVKFINLYNTRIDEDVIISVVDCDMKYNDKKDYKYLRPFVISNDPVFADDPIHLFVFIDKDFYTGIDFESTISNVAIPLYPIKSNYDYFAVLIENIISAFDNVFRLKSYTKLVAAILYNDGDMSDDENKLLDKILKEACAINADYIRIDHNDKFREILREYNEPGYIRYPNYS